MSIYFIYLDCLVSINRVNMNFVSKIGSYLQAVQLNTYIFGTFL